METIVLFWFVTGCAFLIAFTPSFASIILWLLYRESEPERRLRAQIAELKSEQLGVNMVNEFAKHAKLERRIISATTALKNQSSNRSTSRLKVKFGANVLLYVISCVLIVFLVWQYGRQPVIRIPPAWIYPLDWIIITQSADEVGISMTFWLLVSSTVAKIVYRCI